MYSTYFIADKLLEQAAKANSELTHMKLQKLVYIANGIHLATAKEPLISEPIEAWDYGPVVSSLYNVYRIFGSSNITMNPVEGITPQQKLTDAAKKAITDAWTIGKNVDGIKLSNWTHQEGSPWTEAKKQGLKIIPNEIMKSYFSTFLGKTE